MEYDQSVLYTFDNLKFESYALLMILNKVTVGKKIILLKMVACKTTDLPSPKNLKRTWYE